MYALRETINRHPQAPPQGNLDEYTWLVPSSFDGNTLTDEVVE